MDPRPAPARQQVRTFPSGDWKRHFKERCIASFRQQRDSKLTALRNPHAVIQQEWASFTGQHAMCPPNSPSQYALPQLDTGVLLEIIRELESDLGGSQPTQSPDEQEELHVKRLLLDDFCFENERLNYYASSWEGQHHQN
mmetsp:Transcript_14836/g.37697  ORF Transcript_14836/g.37697 Transcript_14836/m.37697 type:complete len:140 (+) Transcript_14836:19-438(+)